MVSSFFISIALVAQLRAEAPSVPQPIDPWKKKIEESKPSSAPNHGRKVVETNREIKELRKNLEKVRDENGIGSSEYKKAKESLEKKRDERDSAVEALGPDATMRRKMRRNIANDKKSAEREKESEKNYQANEEARTKSRREKEAKRAAEKEQKEKAEEKAEEKDRNEGNQIDFEENEAK